MADNYNNLKWIGAGAKGGSIDLDETSSSTIAFASATQGTPFNIRLDSDDPSISDNSYYEVKIINMGKDASLGVGLVTANGFQPGWKTKGCFYNGNITNGSAGLVIGFGKCIEEGDTVGVYQKCGERCNNIIFYHNGRCLGAGFSLGGNNQNFFPCLNLSGKATVRYSTPLPPTIFEREQEKNSNDDPYSGDWAIEQAFTGPELHEIPLPENSTFKVSFEKAGALLPDQYHVSIKISNSFRTSFKITGKMEAFDKIDFTGHCMSTRMRPMPGFDKVEQFISSAVRIEGGFQKMIVGEDGKLIMSGPTEEMICSRYFETFEPVESID